MKIEYFRSAAYFPGIKVCTCSDIHIGIEDALQAEGFSMPLDEERELQERFNDIIKKFKPETIVLNGDILHEFHRLRRNTKKSFDRIMLSLIASVDNIIVITGSHDKMLELALQDIDGVTAEEFFFKGGVLFTHGNTIPSRANDPDVKLIVLGHEHPSLDIELKKQPCFLYGKKTWRGKDVLVLPAFNPLCSGTTINYMDSRDFMSAFIKEGDIGKYRPIITADDEALEFPMLKEFRDILNI
ncbi:metallophosphoesterase [Methanocella sp. CWC-04]|uniref:Metallophosphoesterase n=1 Tax=Methanooceanicella nereidis TaxID=2052831 RepID=A0AAP2W610_9EURY|nr:metallophosphoesterase [Methanocella sp. CWC-04]